MAVAQAISCSSDLTSSLEPPYATGAALKKIKIQINNVGVPAVAQWVKNPTIVAWVFVEMWV